MRGWMRRRGRRGVPSSPRTCPTMLPARGTLFARILSQVLQDLERKDSFRISKVEKMLSEYEGKKFAETISIKKFFIFF